MSDQARAARPAISATIAAERAHTESPRQVRKAQRLSSVLRAIAEDSGRDRISLGDLCDTFADRAFATLIFVFAAPVVLPIPIPGFSALAGLPLLFLTFQLAQGRRVPWLPGWIRERSFRRSDLAVIVDRIEPSMVRIERYLRPRLTVLVQPATERVVGVLCFLLAIILFLPIPLGNMLPAFAISLAALAILERDGILMIMSCLMAGLSFVVVSGVVYAMLKAAMFLIEHALAF
jgi:hypothetical protein